jgi:hypothetical protein
MRKIDRLRAERREPERPLPRRVPVASRLNATMLGKPGFPVSRAN